MRVPALLYHHVGQPSSQAIGAGLSIPVEKFERQMRWLSRGGYVSIRPADWLAWRQEGRPLPCKPVLLTFDDGYADFPENVLPTLQRLGFRATIFAIAGREAWQGMPLMSPAQIRACCAQGIEFGAHTRTHSDLTALTTAQVREEVVGSQEDLAAIVGKRVSSFAYPFGFFNEAVRDVVRQSCDLAFTCEEGLNDAGTDPFRLHRSMVQPGDLMTDFACRVRLGWSPITALRARLRIRSRIRELLRAARSLGE
jgi:peptidoglycan/xylan/chitin deacetylase (PgdA/CDA1 family)